MKAKIYHNPRCSKSRATLALLRERGVDLEIIDYIATPPSKATLRELMRKLGGPALAMVRTEEQAFRPHAQRALTDEEVVDLLAAEPRLLQRPIVELGARARIGRPPERVLELIE
jgi:arsenate reductase (glutaredoxin)